MKFKRFIHVGLVLGVSLLGYSIAGQPHAPSVIERLHPPSVDQVKKWAAFPERTLLTMSTNIPDDATDDDDSIGKFKWFWTYEDHKGSNYTRVVIAVFEPRGFWPAKRAMLINASEQIHKKYLEQKHPDTINPIDKEGEAFAREMGPMTLPNGQKSYGFLLGPAPARFALHPGFDVLAYEAVEPASYDERHPPADLTDTGTNSLSEFFTNVDAFLISQ